MLKKKKKNQPSDFHVENIYKKTSSNFLRTGNSQVETVSTHINGSEMAVDQ